MWTSLTVVRELCTNVETLIVKNKRRAHVALTGGCLYKPMPRKDLDLLFYRVRQASEYDKVGILEDLLELGFSDFEHFGWVAKARWDGKDVDLFFPEQPESWQTSATERERRDY